MTPQEYNALFKAKFHIDQAMEALGPLPDINWRTRKYLRKASSTAAIGLAHAREHGLTLNDEQDDGPEEGHPL